MWINWLPFVWVYVSKRHITIQRKPDYKILYCR